MSDLQTALAAIGVCVVAGVYIFNRWQERQFRRRVEQAFEREHEDALIPPEGGATSPEIAEERIEPRLDPPLAAAKSITPAASAAQSSEIDPAIDFVVEVALPAAVDDASIHNELLLLTGNWNKRVLAAGFDEASGQWHAVSQGSAKTCTQWKFAVQMSNRAGCIDADSLARFLAAIERWAEGHGATSVQSPAVDAAHTMAAQLDRFCADVDIAIGMNVVAVGTDAFAGSKIRALAEAGGLTLEGDGVFYLRNDAGQKIYSLDNHEPMPFVPEQMKTLTTSGITFLLDVPCVSEGIDAFENMLATARSFAQTLGGVLVDDNRRPLTDEAIGKIRHQLTGILAKMQAGQIAAGGPRALRLFS